MWANFKQIRYKNKKVNQKPFFTSSKRARENRVQLQVKNRYAERMVVAQVINQIFITRADHAVLSKVRQANTIILNAVTQTHIIIICHNLPLEEVTKHFFNTFLCVLRKQKSITRG